MPLSTHRKASTKACVPLLRCWRICVFFFICNLFALYCTMYPIGRMCLWLEATTWLPPSYLGLQLGLEQLLVAPPVCFNLLGRLHLYPPTQGAPASTGCALCSVLANLAMHEEFRGSFARPFSPRAAATAGGGTDGGRASTVAGVLELVARDMTVRSLHASRTYASPCRGRKLNGTSCTFPFVVVQH